MHGAEIDWERLDKGKFFGLGAGLFTGVTLALYPLSVLKTRLQIATAQPDHYAQTSKGAAHRHAATGMLETARTIARTEGVPGFYRGIGTIITGMLPVRVLYTGALEVGKSAASSALGALGGPHALGLSDAGAAGLASGLGGICASLSTQAVVVPMDVISSRLMAQAADTRKVPGQERYAGGLDALRTILRSEGLRGLYRGFGVSVATYAPSGFTWWGTYGAVQRTFWNFYAGRHGARTSRHGNREPHDSLSPSGDAGLEPAIDPPSWLVPAVQAASGMAAGLTAAVVTTPLDTVKTRVQVARGAGQQEPVSVAAVVRQVLAEGGVRGLYRGLLPRAISMSLWGTAMVSSYEFLKRHCVKRGG